MPGLNISNAVNGSSNSGIDDYQIATKNLESGGDTEETQWINTQWPVQWGWFNQSSELKSALILKTIWEVGGGYTCDSGTSVILDYISGWGKDTFDDILFNMKLIARIGGDSFAEIVKDASSGKIINIKVLDPSTIRIIVGRNNIILRYEQIAKTDKTVPGVVTKFEPKNILHFSNNRLGNQIHGISDIDILIPTLQAEEENFPDMKSIMHRQAIPFILWKLKTDDKTKIAEFVQKVENARKLKGDMYIPDDENIATYEVININISAVIFEWRNEIRNKFYRVIGLPEILPSGASGATESGSKVGYLAFEQIIKKEQRQIEKWIWNQLFMKIKLASPDSLAAPLQQTNAALGQGNGMLPQPSDLQAGIGR